MIPAEAFSRIEGNLWMGCTPAYTGGAQQFKFIVCLYPWEQYPTSKEQVVTEAWLFDHEHLPDERLLAALADYVNAVRVIGPTLVHCQAGMNRSGLVTALALIRGGRTPENAIALIRERRDVSCLFNASFRDWLMKQRPGRLS